MTAKLKYSTESYRTDCGGTNIKFWISEYEDIDPNIFVLKEEFDMFHNPRISTFHTIATPELFCEYPVGEPETEGGFYRTDHIYLSFEKQESLTEFIANLDRRIAKLCINFDILNDPKNYYTDSIITKYGELIFTYTKKEKLSNCRQIKLPDTEKRLLVKKTDNLGTLFLDVCTDEDMFVYPDNPSENIYRTNEVSLCCAYKPMLMVKDTVKKLLAY